MGGMIGLLHPYSYHQDIGPKLRIKVFNHDTAYMGDNEGG